MRVGGQLHAPATLPLGKRPGTHCTEGWVGPRASNAYEVPTYKLHKARSGNIRIFVAVVLLWAAIYISQKIVCSTYFIKSGKVKYKLKCISSL
jgi:hypothetical protein